ncbi:MAG: sigma-70 family RNA polymerase sigma factor, partial [Tepidisphaeraceae bacterium]
MGVVEARLFDKKSAPELLEEFRATGAQAPFEEIVRRYAGMVYSCCLRVTKNGHDAEDATQAVFLALAVQGKTAKPIRYIGPWLQQVAHRLSLDIRRSKKRQKAREEKVGEMMRSTNGNGHPNGNGNGHAKDCPSKAYEQDELKRVINDEINQLPSKYRLPLILHYFGGLTREEMAKELNVRPNTLGVRVYRGRELLGKRLAQRGMTLGAGALALVLTDSVSLRINESLILSTCHAVAAATGGVGGGPSVGASVFASQIFGITQSITRGMLMSKIKFVATIAIALGSVGAMGSEIISRVAPLDLRFSLPLDITTRLRDMFRSFVQPIQFNSAAGDENAGDPLPDLLDDAGPAFAAGSWHYADPLAERYMTQGAESLGVPSLPARDEDRTVIASAQASSSSSAAQQVASAAQVVGGAETTAGHSVAGAVPSNVAAPTAGSGLPQVRS